METNKQSISIKIAERVYPMKVVSEDEEIFRKAANLVNDRITKYKRAFFGEDEQDFLAMTAFHYAVEKLKIDRDADHRPLVNTLQEINSNLERYISEIE